MADNKLTYYGYDGPTGLTINFEVYQTGVLQTTFLGTEISPTIYQATIVGLVANNYDVLVKDSTGHLWATLSFYWNGVGIDSAQPPITLNRQELANFCLRQLGGGIINVEITPDQIADNIDQAINFYHEYHFDGVERDYFAHQITTTDKTNKYLTCDEGIAGVIKVLNLSSIVNSGDYLFNVQYQIMMSEIINLTSQGYSYLYNTMSYLGNLDFVLKKEKDFRFNRRWGRIYLDINWNTDVQVGDYVVVEVYRYLDDTTYPKMLKDVWLRNYSTALLKRQWGNNLKKYQGMQLPGGLTYNGQQIYDEAVAEISKLEAEAINSSAPLEFMVG